jgi:ABC-type Fe3+-hydroxamate transport system substrate-binding protein
VRRADMQRRNLILSSMAALVLGTTGLPLPVVHAMTSTTRDPRVVVLDWGLTETLLAMGVVPVGVAEVADYNANVVTPGVSRDVIDVGLRLSPSLELLARLAPDLILINSSQESQRAVLEQIAPVRAFAVYSDVGHPYQRSEEVTRELGVLLGRTEAAQTLIRNTATAIAADRARIEMLLHQAQRRSIYVFRFFDPRHVGIYGAKSLIDDVLKGLNLENAWQGRTDYWGIGVEPLEALGTVSAADLLYFEPLPPGGLRRLSANRLWNALPSVAQARATALGPFWGFGMLPSAQRFSAMMVAALGHLATLENRSARPPVSTQSWGDAVWADLRMRISGAA